MSNSGSSQCNWIQIDKPDFFNEWKEDVEAEDGYQTPSHLNKDEASVQRAGLYDDGAYLTARALE